MRMEAFLIFLLRLGAVVLFLAIIAIFLPFEWMVAAHSWLGLRGDLPDLPIVGYLTRSLSFVYALWGLMFWYVSTDVRRYLPIIRLLAWLNILMGLVFVPLDILVGMPASWVMWEGPPVFLYGVLLWWAANRFEATRLV